MKKNFTPLLFSFVYVLLCFNLSAQNIVPNSSFEKVTRISNGWISSDQIFEARMKGWTVPNLGSPDIFFNKIKGKIWPPRKGLVLTSHRARTGQMMVGFKTYGCITATQHCKEYMQVELTERIEKGEEYFIEFWVNPVSTSIKTNNIGLAFSDVEIQDNSPYGLHYFDPAIIEKSVIKNSPNDWFRISGTVKADGNYNYAIIGNFYTDDETEIDTTGAKIDYSFYLIDDVLIRPLKAKKEFDFTTEKLEVGQSITLNNITFSTGKSDLLPASFEELNMLLQLLNKDQKVKIQLNGHTDNVGNETDNLFLSKQRAAAVANYLIKKGIAEERVLSDGFGEERPISSNETEEGKQLNRRVEFLVIGK